MKTKKSLENIHTSIKQYRYFEAQGSLFEFRKGLKNWNEDSLRRKELSSKGESAQLRVSRDCTESKTRHRQIRKLRHFVLFERPAEPVILANGSVLWYLGKRFTCRESRDRSPRKASEPKRLRFNRNWAYRADLSLFT